MAEFALLLWMFFGLVGAHVAGSGSDCGAGECAAVPNRPTVAWSVHETLRADEVRLFARGERRPGQPGHVLVLDARPDREVLVVPPAEIRVRVSIGQRERRLH